MASDELRVYESDIERRTRELVEDSAAISEHEAALQALQSSRIEKLRDLVGEAIPATAVISQVVEGAQTRSYKKGRYLPHHRYELVDVLGEHPDDPMVELRLPGDRRGRLFVARAQTMRLVRDAEILGLPPEGGTEN